MNVFIDSECLILSDSQGNIPGGKCLITDISSGANPATVYQIEGCISKANVSKGAMRIICSVEGYTKAKHCL